jgi:hypothetical protein
VGSGDSRRGAEDDAAGALARLFTVNVKVDALSQKRYAELVKSDTTYTESEIAISQTVGTQANEQFVNLRFSDPYTDERGVTHVVAYLEREPTAAIYRTLIQKDLAKIEDFKSRGGARKEVLQRYAFYDAARSVGLNAERLIAQLRIIHPAAARLMEAQFDMTHVNEAIDREAAKMTYLVAITGDNDGRIGGLVRKCMDSLSLSFHQRGPLMVKGSWNIEPVTLNPQFKSVRWTADFSLYDEAGRAIATFVKQTRENAISDAEARGFAYREAEKAISRDFAGSIRAYLTRVVTGG